MDAPKWGFMSLFHGIGMYTCEFRPLVSLNQSFAYSFAAFWFIQVFSVDICTALDTWKAKQEDVVL